LSNLILLEGAISHERNQQVLSRFFCQAEGVSQSDIERGNNPAVETVELGTGN